MASDSHAKRPIVVERRKEKGRKKTPRLTKTYDVKIIPATVGVVAETEEPPKKRVAAYCRVSTDQEAQETSLEEQMAHFNTVIAEHPDWELAGIYADEGISGTQVKHRVQFQQMIEDAKAKKIDLILTKSISRFARNVVDCLTNIRLLRNLRPPVSVYFDKERLDSLDEKAEVFLTMLASFAQEESRSISTNIKWATRSRMKAGTQKISTTSLLGYDTDDDGEMVIVTNEAEIVRTIYMSFDKGMHPAEIAEKLNALEIRTIKNNPWTGESVKNILRNEKYCGDVLMQKTYTVDCLTHKTKKNEGEVEQYFIPDHHPAIVEREIWDKAQVRLEQIAGKRRRIRQKQQRLVPLRKGVLLGFVPIRPTWKAVSFKRLETATEKVMALVDAKPEQVHIEYESEECEMEILKGFEVTLCKYQWMDYVLYFGRFSEEKGIGTLIKVCKIVLRNIIFKVVNIIYIFAFVKTKDDIIIYLFGVAFFGLINNLSYWISVPKYINRPILNELHPSKHIKTVIALFVPTIAMQVSRLPVS